MFFVNYKQSKFKNKLIVDNLNFLKISFSWPNLLFVLSILLYLPR